MSVHFTSGSQWLHDRRLIGSTFHFGILEQFAVIQSEKAEILTKYLDRELEGNPGEAIDIFPFILRFTLDVICGNATLWRLNAAIILSRDC